MKTKLATSLAALLLAAPAFADAPEGSVTAITETPGIIGDADDPAIWVHPTDPMASLVLGTDKYNGLFVYNLQGEEVGFFNDGSINNVDIREFSLGGETVWLASATERDEDDIVFYVIRADGTVERASPHRFEGMPEYEGRVRNIYGHAMGRDPETGRVWVYVNFKTGQVAQYEVLDNGGQLDLVQSRVLSVETQPEGMVIDDDAGTLYVGEEDVAIWRFPAFPEDGDEATRIASIPSDCFPRDDIEGLTLYNDGENKYLMASAQYIHRVAVFPIIGDTVPVCAGLVEIAAGDIDGVTETDGLDVVATPLGDAYPKGMLVMMDDQNANFTTNFKFISAADVLESLKLD